MALGDIISHRIREEQRRVFRVATDPMRYGLTLKAIGIDTGIPYSTLRTYADGSSMMPIDALYKLCGVIPDELLSLLLPEGRCIVTQSDDDDHDGMASRCMDFAAELQRARHPESEAGVDIGPGEHNVLSMKRKQIVT